MPVIELQGQENLPEAIETIAAQGGPDLVVVRGLVTDPNVLHELTKAHTEDKQNEVSRELMYSSVPSLSDADKTVARLWKTHGYTDFQDLNNFRFDQAPRRGGIGMHTDIAEREEGLEAITLASLCLEGIRKFVAVRTEPAFIRSDGSFDEEAFMRSWDEMNALSWQGPQPKAQTVLLPGDVALFAHHPMVTGHSAESYDSTAQLFGWRAHPTK